MPTRIFIEILFIKVNGTEDNTTVHQEKNEYIHCIIFKLEYYTAVKTTHLTGKCKKHDTSLRNIMLSNKAGYRKYYIQKDSIYIKFQNMQNDIILFRNPNSVVKQ